MLRSATAGQALASDFLRLEAQRDVLEGKQWQCLEDMENRKLVNQQRQKAYADILDRRLRVEGKQQSVTKERNLVIRTEATKLCSGRAEGEAINHIRARKERFGVEVEQMWKDWQQRVAAKIREDIEVARRDAEHCKARQQEAMEVALTQERLLVDLLEAEFLAQKEREKLYEEVEEQQKRLRQRLHEERHALDERLQAFTTRPPTVAPGAAGSAPSAASAFVAAAAPPPSAAAAGATTSPSARQGVAEAPVTASKACGRAASNDAAGFVPKAGTRHFEVYQQLRRNEMEMQADLRLLEDRQLIHCLHCGSTRAPPGSPSGRCDVCGHFVELLQLPPQIARGPALRVNVSQPRTSDAVTQALSLRPAPPALASRGPPRVPDGRVTQPDDVALLLASRPCPSRGAPLDSRLHEARNLVGPAAEAMQISTTRLSTPRDEALPADDCDAASGSALPAALPPPVSEEAQAHETDDPELMPVVATQAQASGEILGSLGILEVPLGPLLAPPESAPRVPALRASVAARGDNDWYGSSTSGTPRKEEEGAKNAVPPASESSAEDLHFPSGHNSPRGEEKPGPVPRPILSEVAENTTASDAVPEMERLPIRTAELQEAEDTEEADLDAMIPFSAREKVQRQNSPHLQVVEQPQVPIAAGKVNQAVRSPEGSKSSLGFASPEVPQEASAGSFSFGEQGQNGLGVLGEASPLEEGEGPAKGFASTGASSTSEAPAPVLAAGTSDRQGDARQNIRHRAPAVIEDAARLKA